jgi:hypothetical protein
MRGKKNPTKSSGWSNLFLMALNAIQLAVIVTILTMWRHSNSAGFSCPGNKAVGSVLPPLDLATVAPVVQSLVSSSTELVHLPTARAIASTSTSPITAECTGGVATTLFLHSPKWFQRRYLVMVQNMRANIPSSWCVQVFHTGEGQSKNGVDINKGLKRMIDRGEVKMTLIPEDLFAKKRKKKMLMTDPWMWENMLAERVMVFGGNQVRCGNAEVDIETNFGQYDYIGTPWHDVKGRGGDGGISLRSRAAMLAAIQFREDSNTGYNGQEREDVFFVRTLVEMEKVGQVIKFPGTATPRVPIIAPKQATEVFGGIRHFMKHFNETVDDRNTETIGPPFVASGTLPSMPYDMRDAFMTICPEIKMIFPSLHEPACFGAHPDAEGCRKSICALRVPRRKGGC